MCFPDIYHKSDLPGVALSRAKATYIINAVALRQTIPGSVRHLARSLGFSDSAIPVYVHRLRMTRSAWERLSPLMTDEERSAFLREVEVPE